MLDDWDPNDTEQFNGQASICSHQPLSERRFDDGRPRDGHEEEANREEETTGPRDYGTTGPKDQEGETDDLKGEGPTDQAPFRVGFLDKARGQVEKAEEEKAEKLKGVGVLAFRLSSISALPHFSVSAFRHSR